MNKYIGSIKHPIHKELGYDIVISQHSENEIKLCWYDFSGEDYEFLTPEWAILKTNELFNVHHAYLDSGGGNGRNWMRLKRI